MPKIIKNPLVLFCKIFRKYPFKTILTLILMELYAGLHESIHYWTALFFGYQTNIRWSILLPTVQIPPAANLVQGIMMASTPYFLDLFLILMLFSFKKGIWAKIVSSIALFDFTMNIIFAPIAFMTRLPNDFRIMFVISKLWFSFMIFVWVVAFVFWWVSVVGKRGRKKV